MTKTLSVATVILLAGFLWAGCSDDTTQPDPVGPSNHAPAAPTIGAPTDGATGVATNTTLSWSCTDSDGDVLQYDVHLGEDSSPSAVATDHTTTSYATGLLAYNTTYYWKVVAKDPGGQKTTSATWSFTTAAQAVETVSTPTTPAGPASGETAQYLSYSTGGATSSMGHTVEYRFDWGGGNYSPWVAASSAQNSWPAAGTYAVRAQARCASHTTVESDWSGTHDVVISAPQEIIYAPGTPVGPTSGTTGESYTYTLNHGGSSSLGHDVEYSIDWDDGTQSDWSASTSASHTWSSVGTYHITATARCAAHNNVVSASSIENTIVITDDAETVSTPYQPNGPFFVYSGTGGSFSVSGSVSSHGHTVEYRFDWDDGTFSGWVGASVPVSHSWPVHGTHYISAQARCAADTLVVSGWSMTKTLDVREYVAAPDRPSGPATGLTGESITFTTGGGSTSEGHDLEYRFKYANSGGTGPYSDWSSETSASYVFDTPGTYYVYAQCRCAVHTQFESNNTFYHQIVISAP